jgi:hypothetical protein
MSEDKLLDRVFAELDRNTTNIEKLSKVVYTQSSTLSLVTKIVVVIITFLIITSLTILYDKISDKKNNSYQENKNGQINNVIKEDYLATAISKKGLLKDDWEKLVYKYII